MSRLTAVHRAALADALDAVIASLTVQLQGLLAPDAHADPKAFAGVYSAAKVALAVAEHLLKLIGDADGRGRDAGATLASARAEIRALGSEHETADAEYGPSAEKDSVPDAEGRFD